MNKKLIFLFFILFFSIRLASGQTNFREGFEAANPIEDGLALSFEEKELIYKDLVDKGIKEKDDLKQIYGFLYLFYDGLRKSDYAEAAGYLLKAEQIAEASGNAGWIGWVNHRRGILFVYLDKEKEAIEAYKKAASNCGAAGDSLCLAESLEQIGSLNSRLDNFEEARHYFNLAVPLIEKFGKEKQLGATLNNLGIMLSRQDKPAEAIPYIERGIAINHKIENYRAEGKGRNNLADAYRRLGQTEKAIEVYKDCVQFNEKHNLLESIITNYEGLYVTYEGIGDYQSAFEYYVKHIELRDSIIGFRTKSRIAELEAQYESERKELELQKSQTRLAIAQRNLERGAVALIFLLMLTGLGLWRWRRNTLKSHRELNESRENLTRLTRRLLEKNKQISSLEEQVSKLQNNAQATTDKGGFEENLYNQRILTKDDWSEFKIYFEKSYPGYLMRLRSAFPAISEAEERLFLFIKLNLTRKEISAILGISSESVKRTRNRLRKRLELEQEIQLKKFIQEF